MREPYFVSELATIYNSNALEALKAMPDESVQMAMTSPPYWGLRNYVGSSDIVWGSKEECEHEWHTREWFMHNGRGDAQKSGKYSTQDAVPDMPHSDSTCSLCGAWRGQLGLEPIPELYVEHLMMIFREVKRVLRKDGSFYLNIGDTYASGQGTCYNPGGNAYSLEKAKKEAGAYPLNRGNKSTLALSGLQPKCMTLIPERVVFAMMDDGWILRNKIVWHKPNSMPSSVKDRFTTTWEYLYFFTKAGRYYFNLDAVREPHKTQSLERYQRGVNLDRPAIGKSAEVGPMQQYTRAPQWFKETFPLDPDYKGKFDDLFGRGPDPQSFNLRVWDVKRGKGGSTAEGGELKASNQEVEKYSYPESGGKFTKHDRAVGRLDHFAYPDPLRTKDYSPKGKNPGDIIEVGRPPVRDDERAQLADKQKMHTFYTHSRRGLEYDNPKGKNPGDYWDITTHGFKGAHFAVYPEKLCERPIRASSRVGDTVLDPFAGSGTTGVVAKRLGRKCILIDSVQPYCAIARDRITKVEYQPEMLG